jgi:rsbT co-antagonist protein RsbR
MTETADIESLQQEITQLRRRVEELEQSETRSRTVFENAPIALWEEDFSEVKRFVEELRRAGVQDLRAHFAANQDAAVECAQRVRVVDVNQAALEMYRAASKAELLAGIDRTFGDNALQAFSEEVAMFASGERAFACEMTAYTLDREPLQTLVNVLLLPDAEDRWSLALVATIDITARRQAERMEQQARTQEEIIRAQRGVIEALSAPVIPVGDEILVMPLVGELDRGRMDRITAALLQEVDRSRAAFAIVDVTGVPTVDPAVADALVRAAQAVRLLGASVVLTGIRPEVAQTLVGLGVDLQGIATCGTLRAGLDHAEARRRRGKLPARR